MLELSTGEDVDRRVRTVASISPTADIDSFLGSTTPVDWDVICSGDTVIYHPDEPPSIPRAERGGWDDGVVGNVGCTSLMSSAIAMEPVRTDIVMGDPEGERILESRVVAIKHPVVSLVGVRISPSTGTDVWKYAVRGRY